MAHTYGSDRRYREAHRAEIAAYGRRYYATNRERIRAKAKLTAPIRAAQAQARYQQNKEAVKAARKAYYQANKAKVIANNTARRKAHPRGPRTRAAWASYLRRAYGITFEAYDAMVVAQCGRCAICNVVPDASAKFHLDHDHTTGTCRALLCFHCNNGLGHFRDSVALLQQATQYLIRHLELNNVN